MENDLTKICQAIPVSTNGDASTQASSILKGLTGETENFNLGGNQPTLYPMRIDQAMNKAVISNPIDNANGAFQQNATVIVRVNGVEVSLVNNKYDIQPSDDGKTLTVNLKQTNFQDGISSITLVYQSVDYGSVTVSIDTTNLSSGKNLVFGFFQAKGSTYQETFSLYNDGEFIDASTSAKNRIFCFAVINDSVLTLSTVLPKMAYLLMAQVDLSYNNNYRYLNVNGGQIGIYTVTATVATQMLNYMGFWTDQYPALNGSYANPVAYYNITFTLAEFEHEFTRVYNNQYRTQYSALINFDGGNITNGFIAPPGTVLTYSVDISVHF